MYRPPRGGHGEGPEVFGETEANLFLEGGDVGFAGFIALARRDLERLSVVRVEVRIDVVERRHVILSGGEQTELDLLALSIPGANADARRPTPSPEGSGTATVTAGQPAPQGPS
jgi:hypothetical protein